MISAIQLLAAFVTLPAQRSYHSIAPFPNLTVPSGWGVNIHFTDPGPGELEKLARAGFKWVRMDFMWHQIESIKGSYDFSPYDRLMSALKKNGLRPIFILDYGNDLYQHGSPRTVEARRAFGKFVEKSITHFRGQGIVWETWNEPNISFWKPVPNVEEYIALATEVGIALRRVSPDEWLVGPGTSGMDWSFLEHCFKAGLLKYWDAVSVHPYREDLPESVAADWARLRSMIDFYSPKGRIISAVSSEWGYSTPEGGLSTALQSAYACRQYLVNLMSGAPLSIWYDWKDDFEDPKDREAHFGTVTTKLAPKQAYREIQRVSQSLAGYRFAMRLAQESPDQYVLVFNRGNSVKYAAWTTSQERHPVSLRLGSDSQALTLGIHPTIWTARHPGMFDSWNPLPPTIQTKDPATSIALALRLVNDLTAVANKHHLRAEITLEDKETGASQRLPLSSANAKKTARNIADELDSNLSSQSRVLTTSLLYANGSRLSQSALITIWNPVIASLILSNGQVWAMVRNPGKRHGGLTVKIKDTPTVRIPLRLEDQSAIRILDKGVLGSNESVLMGIGQSVGTVNAPLLEKFVPFAFDHFASQDGDNLDAGTYSYGKDGDAKVEATVSAKPVKILSGPLGDSEGLALTYACQSGWKYIFLQPKGELGKREFKKPASLNMFVKGDRSGDALRMRFVDSAGQTFQPDFGMIDWTGWKFVSFNLDGRNSGHWGGRNDGIVRYPIRIDALALVDSIGGANKDRSISLTGITVVERK